MDSPPRAETVRLISKRSKQYSQMKKWRKDVPDRRKRKGLKTTWCAWIFAYHSPEHCPTWLGLWGNRGFELEVHGAIRNRIHSYEECGQENNRNSLVLFHYWGSDGAEEESQGSQMQAVGIFWREQSLAWMWVNLQKKKNVEGKRTGWNGLYIIIRVKISKWWSQERGQQSTNKNSLNTLPLLYK